MGSKIKRNTKFYHDFLTIGDDENPISYMIIVVIINDLPVDAYVILMPKAPWQFTYYPYGMN